MIKGFEKETSPLTEEELSLVPLFVNGLSAKIGHRNAITNVAMRRKLRAAGHNISDPRVRKVINHIRIHDLVPCLIASGKGYYVAETQEEINDYVKSLTQRIDAQQEVLKATKKQRDYLFETQSTINYEA